MKWLTIICAAVLLVSYSAQASEISGNWARGDGKAHVNIIGCGKDICATNTWVRPGTPKEDIGDQLVMSISETANSKYEGTAFDPKRNLNYSLNVKISGDSMTSKGCVLAGIICRSISWTRLK